MKSLVRSVIAMALSVPFCAWAQQPSTAPSDPAAQLRALKRQLASLQASMNTLRSQLATESAARQALQAELASVKSSVRAIQQNTVLDLNGYLTFDNSSGYPTAQFSGVNVQVVNGTGNTQTTNGVGNVILGYNRPRVTGATCSLGFFSTASECLARGGTWAASHKSGSHNLVGGDFNSYSSWGSLVMGVENSVSAPYAIVLSGSKNAASAEFATIVGGSNNGASAMYSSVGGGAGNVAGGPFSSVSGGAQRSAPAANNWSAGALLQPQ